MKYARISFPTRDVAVKAYHALIQRGRVVSLRGGQYIVPAPAVEFLRDQAMTHTLHEWLTADHVAQALRNTPAGSVQ